MLKKITALLLLVTFTNVYAVSPASDTLRQNEELTKTFDNLNYKLNVEWDQKDVKFFDGAIADFQEEVAALENTGVSKEDLVKFTLEKIKDQEVRNEINELGKVINASQMTNEEARAFVVSKLSNTYARGASWSGSRMGGHTAFIMGVIIIVLIVVHHNRTTDTTTTITNNNCDCYPRTYCDQYQYPSLL